MTAATAIPVRNSDAHYRALFAAHPQSMWVYDAETLNFLAVNDAALLYYGYSEAEFLALSVHDIRAPTERRRFVDAHKPPTPDRRQMESWRHVRKNGDVIDVTISAHPIVFAGRPARLVMVQDVTAQRRAEAERAVLQRALLQAQKMESVGRLAGGVAHDFNNLLTVMAGYANLLLEEVSIDADVRAKIEEIAFAAARARELTSKLLIFSRKHPYEPRLIAIDHLVEEESQQLPRVIGEHITVRTHLSAPATFVRIDPAQLTQVVINLVVNARDAMPNGGALTITTDTVTLDARRVAAYPGARGGDYVRLSVADTGCGMSTEVQQHLFEPFFTTKQSGQGTGLGLATVYGLVQQAAGFIEVETAQDAGTTMTVFLPASKEAGTIDRREQQARVRGGAETILVVEDEDGVRLLTRTILERLGYTIVEASNPADAIQLVVDGLRPDLVLTDVVMPEMNGGRMVAEIQKMITVEVLYVSGFADTGRSTEVHTDAGHFLSKPFNPEVLCRKIRDLLDKKPA